MISVENSILNIDDYIITETPNGLNTLTFDISEEAQEFPLIKEEAVLKEDGQEYLVKKVQSKGNGTSKVEAIINLDAWKHEIITYDSKTAKSMAVALEAVKPSGWIIEDATQATKNRLIQLANVTPYDVLQECISRYGWAVKIEKNKLTIINPANYRYAGAFVIEGLNLQKLTYAGETKSFCTKLYAEGADGLNFASINGGKNYIEDYSYTDKVVCMYWKDERYKDANALLEDARAKLSDMCQPVIEYKCKITDIAAVDETRQDLKLGLLTVVRLIDSTRGNSVDMQVVEYKRHPEHPEKNELTISTKATPIKGTLETISESMAETDDATRSVVQVQFDKLRQAIAEGSGMYTTIVTDAQGASIIYLHDANTLETSQIIWTMTADGISVSTDGGQTITAGLSASGTAVLSRIYAQGINADYINAGHIKAERMELASGGNLYNTGYDTFEQITNDKITWHSLPNVVATIDSSTSYYGSKCLKLTATANNGYCYLGVEDNNYGCIPVQPGKIYMISAWIKTSVSDPTTNTVECYVIGHKTPNDKANAGITYKAAKVGSDWERVYYTHTATAEWPWIELRFDNEIGAGGIVWIDAVQVEEIKPGQLPSNFSPSSPTMIDGSNLFTGTVTADNIRAGSVITGNFEAQNVNVTGGSVHMDTSTDTYDAIVLNGPTYSASMTPSGFLSKQELGNVETEIKANGVYKKIDGKLYTALTSNGLTVYADGTSSKSITYDNTASFIKRGKITTSIPAGGTVSTKITVSQNSHGINPTVVVTPVGANCHAYIKSIEPNGANVDVTISIVNDNSTTSTHTCHYMIL